ncbi:MAG: DUF6155 family protein [Lysinibacillus sp.]
MTKITLTALKKELKQFEQKELIQLVAELYKLNDDVKHYVSNRFLGEEAILALYETTIEKIGNEFFPERGHGKLRLKEAKNAIANFKKLTGDHEKTVDLMLIYVEFGTKFTNTYGDIDGPFYDSMITMYGKVTDACDEDEALFHTFKDRLYGIIEETEGLGWGYHDCVCDSYYTIEWVVDEEDEDEE